MEVTVSEQLPPSKDELKGMIADKDVLIMRVIPRSEPGCAGTPPRA